MKKHAMIETLGDLINSVKSFGDVDVLPRESGVRIEAWPYTLTVMPHDAMFHWTLKAKDDPSDSDEGYASDPLDAILESLSEETPAGDIWKQLASDPQKLADFLRVLATTDVKTATISLKRIVGFLRTASSNMLLELHQKEIDKIVGEAKKRGWNASVVKGPGDLPVIEFEIGDHYEGDIMLSNMMYEYKFEVDGFPAVSERAVTDSVVSSLKKWMRRKDVDSAAEQVENSDTEKPANFDIPIQETIRERM